MGIAGMGFYFLLEIQASFVIGIPNFKILGFRKIFFFKFGFQGFIEKYVGCFLVYLVLKWFFLLKVQKECVFVIILKIALLLVKIYVLVGEKGISGLLRQVAAKPAANVIFMSQ